MDLTQSLFQWLKTFDFVSNCGSVKDLCDGVAIAHVLNQICPEFFNNEWLNKMETDCGTNWRLRVSNLRKIYEALDDYYREVLDKQLDEKLLPEVTLIARDFNTEQLALLLQLVLGCAINCSRKDHFIAIMANLDLDVQHGIKTAIQQMDTELSPKFSERIKVLQSYEPNNSQKDSFEEVFQRLNNQIIGLQNQLSKTEEIKEDYRLNAELREKDVIKLRQQLMTKLNDMKQDRDELDQLRDLNEEFQIHKNKLNEELKETKRQMKSIQERNHSLTERICELEGETKKVSVLKGQIDVYKKAKEDLRLKVGEEGYRADRAEDETNRLNKMLDELIQERDKHIQEMNNLRLQFNQLKEEFENNKLKTDFDESNSLREMEARLMTIAFHNLSSHLQRKSAEDRIRNGSLNSASFLARKRQITTRKYNLSTVPTVNQK